MKIFLMALFGSMGVLVRYGLMHFLPNQNFPWAILTANVVGSFLAGIIFTVFVSNPESVGSTSNLLGSLILVGFLGGLTTFSSFSLDTARLIATSAWSTALINVLVNNLLSIFACFLGLRAATLL